MSKSKAAHVLYGRLYVVQMYRWGDMKGHTYTAGIFDNEYDAKACGVAECAYRGGKYEPVIYHHNLNEWRHGTQQAMFEDAKTFQLPIEEAFAKKEAWEWRAKTNDPKLYSEIQAERRARQKVIDEAIDKYNDARLAADKSSKS